MGEPLVTREEAAHRADYYEALGSWECTALARYARTIVALYDLDAAKDSCIDRLRNGRFAQDGHWVDRHGHLPETMTPAEIEVMSRCR